MGIITIVTAVISAVELASKAKEVIGKAIPSPPNELKDKHRYMQCTLKNATQFQIVLDSTHFDSGKYWTAPESTKAFDQMVFSICNRDNALTGASGGTTFRVTLDSQTSFYFSVGWTNPLLGDLKAGVTESTKAEDGYNKASSNGNSIVSANQYRYTKEGSAVTFEFHVSASPGNQSVFSLNEIIVK